MIWPCDLVCYPVTQFELYLNFIEANILSKFHQVWIKTVASVNKLIADKEKQTIMDKGQRVITKAHPGHLLRC